MKKKLCPKCKTENPAEANFCRRCAYQFNENSLDIFEKRNQALEAKNERLKVKYSKLKEEKDRYERWWCEERKSVSFYKKLFISFLVAFLLTLLAGIIGAYFFFRDIKDSEQTSIKTITENVQSLPNKPNEKLSINKKISEDVVKPTIPNDFILAKGGTLHNKEWDEKNEKYVYCDYLLDDFYICQHEVTQDEYEKTMGGIEKKNYEWTIPAWDSPEKTIHVKGEKIPVVARYKDFVEFCNKKSAEEGYDGFYSINGNAITFNPHGNGYRLLFELEWIYAAKGGKSQDSYKYVGSNSLKEVAWYGGNSNNKPHEVCSKKPNSLGIYDMAGNVSELLETKKKYRLVAGNDFYIWTGYSPDFFTPYDISYYFTDDDKLDFCGARIALITKSMTNKNSKLCARY